MRFPEDLPPPEGGNHKWVRVKRDPEGGEFPADWEHLDAWERYEEKYSVPSRDGSLKRSLTPAIYFCPRCQIMVPETGPRPEDEDCDPLMVALVMGS